MADVGKARLDKWLWAARFFKTRAMAKTAIEGGKVHYQGERCKPSKEPNVGDELQIRHGYDVRTVVIEAISIVRRGAPQAQLLYTETDESLRRREEAAALRKAAGGQVISAHRPTKKQRRQIHRFRDERNASSDD